MQGIGAQQIHFRVVLLLGMRVGVATARMTPEIALKPGADVPEFVEDGDEFLPKGKSMNRGK